MAWCTVNYRDISFLVNEDKWEDKTKRILGRQVMGIGVEWNWFRIVCTERRCLALGFCYHKVKVKLSLCFN